MNFRLFDSIPERWVEVERLFDQVADMGPRERSSHLAKACGDDAELRDYVESLVRADSASSTIVEESIRNVLELAVPDQHSLSDAVGQRIGPYRILRVLGSGGMGVVYLADRVDEHFKQQVAIKVVRQRLLDPEIARRLVSERQILANLVHPNIARLLDGGTTSDGTPYIVMEYIEGVPIDDYCDSRRLDINERLQLFRTICGAVHHAHQNLVVHRDIKSTNILVTGDGTPKLLDFGIAKLLDAGGSAAKGLTREGVLMMTPENAAPEQILNQSITTATDTYALGILLYRLLCGHPPYRITGRGTASIAEIVRWQQPERPSTMAGRRQAPDSRDGEEERIAPDIVARYRGTTSDKLRRRLRGDLDNIALTALRKEPERRYRSVHELSEDIRLHRETLPVLARPDTWKYRTAKFVRRHTAGVAMSSLLVGLLVAFGIVMTVQNQRIANERDTAEEVSTFLEEIFMAPNPGNSRGLDITAKEILARGADKISTELSARPLIQATMMETIGRVYFNLGEYDRSAAMQEESLRLRREILGEGHEDVASSKNELAAALTRQADYDRARVLFQDALEHSRRLFGDSSTEVGAILQNLTELALRTGDLDRAERFARESLEIYERYGDQYPREIAVGKSALARVLVLPGKNELEAAETLNRDAIALIEGHFGEDDPLMAYYLQNLAVVLQTKGDTDAAETTFYKSIDVARKVLGDDHYVLAGSLVMLGTLLHNVQQYDAAEAALREALAVHRRAMGPEHPFVAYDMTSLAMLLYDKGALDDAESLLREALQIYEASLGPDHQYIASTLTELGAVLTEKGSPEAAVLLLERAIAIREKDYPPENPLLAATQTVYAHALARLGRFEEAERLLLDNYPLLSDEEGPMDRRTRRALAWTADLYDSWNKPVEAARFSGLLSEAGVADATTH